MRTTLNIDDNLLKSLKKAAHESGRSLGEVVNEVLLRGLAAREAPAEAAPYRLEPVSMGAPAAEVNLDKALQLADSLEDSAIAEKLEQRK